MTSKRLIQAKLTLFAFCGLYLLAAIPVLSSPIPPLFDYPNHLGRMAILIADGSDPILNRYYAVRWGFLPNLAMDTVVPALAHVMPLVRAGQVFLLLMLGFLAAGPVLLFRALWGYWSPWPCVGFLLLYSRVLLWGFVNYLAGIGLGFATLALWVFLDRRSWLVRGMAGAGAVMVVFFCHLEAFGLLALMLVGFEVPRIWRLSAERSWRPAGARAAALGLALLPASVIFLAFWQPHAAAAMASLRLDRKPDILFSVFDNYARPFDVACFVTVLVAGIVSLVRRRLLFSEAAIVPFGLLAVVYLLLPSTLFTGAGADHRLPLVLFMLLAAATTPSSLTRRTTALLVCTGVALFAVRLAVIESVWLKSASIYRQDLAILSVLKPGTRLAVAAAANAVQVTRTPLYHFPVLAIMLRDAFVPSLFAYDTQQPVALLDPWQSLARQSDPDWVWRAFNGSDPGSMTARQFIFAHYDSVIFAGGPPPGKIDGQCMRLVGSNGGFRLFKIVAALKGC